MNLPLNMLENICLTSSICNLNQQDVCGMPGLAGSVLVLLVGLDVEIKLLADNFFVHLEDLLAGTLEVTGGVVRGSDPKSLGFNFCADWLVDGAHCHENVHNVTEQVEGWLDFLLRSVGLNCTRDDGHVESVCANQVAVAHHRDVCVYPNKTC